MRRRWGGIEIEAGVEVNNINPRPRDRKTEEHYPRTRNLKVTTGALSNHTERPHKRTNSTNQSIATQTEGTINRTRKSGAHP
jgi:hypothetical protein